MFCFLYGSASLEFGGRAGVQPGNGAVFAHLDRFRHGERNMEVSSRGLSSCSRNMHGTSPVASGRNSGAHSALFARSCGGI